MQVGRNAIRYAFIDLAAALQPPDVLIMNMGFWITQRAAELEMQQKFQNIMQEAAALRRSARLCTRLIWKTTSTVKGQEQPTINDFQGWVRCWAASSSMHADSRAVKQI